jgi:hypothetical protein
MATILHLEEARESFVNAHSINMKRIQQGPSINGFGVLDAPIGPVTLANLSIVRLRATHVKLNPFHFLSLVLHIFY